MARKLSNARYNELRREKYRRAREAGLSPAEARDLRSVSKKTNKAFVELSEIKREYNALVEKQKHVQGLDQAFTVRADIENTKIDLLKRAAKLRMVTEGYKATKPTLLQLRQASEEEITSITGRKLTREAQAFYEEAVRDYEGVIGLTKDKIETEEDMWMYEDQQKVFEDTLNRLSDFIEDSRESDISLNGMDITKDHIYRVYGFSELSTESKAKEWLTTAITGYRRGELVI